jgi:hypothetical protein
VLIFEDAALHCQNPDLYEGIWLALAQTVLERVDVTLVLTDMFDDIPEEKIMGIPPDAFRFEALYPSPRTGGQRSHNQAIRDAAATLSRTPGLKGRVVMLDLRQRMDAFKAALGESFGVSPITPEGIHPNVWGEALMVREFLRAAGLASLVPRQQAYLALLADNAGRLAQPRKDIDPAAARTFIDAWLAP